MDNCLMNYHIAAITEDEFFNGAGRITSDIQNAMHAASFGSVSAAMLVRSDYPATTGIEVLAVSTHDHNGPIAGYEQYFELFYLNSPARIASDNAGLKLRYVGTCTEHDLPAGFAIIARLPLFLVGPGINRV